MKRKFWKFVRTLISIRAFLHLTKMGFFLSESVHHDKSDNGLGEFWGFYRFNFENGSVTKYAIFDIDFADGKYADFKGDTHFRVNF